MLMSYLTIPSVEISNDKIHYKLELSYCHVLVTRHGFGLVIGFTGFLQTVTTINYSAITNSHSLQFTIARTKSMSSLGVATQWLPTVEALPRPHLRQWATVSRQPAHSLDMASARTQQRALPPAIPLLLRANCCCGHMTWLPWKGVYRAIP
jgi:hypothetical protein